MTYYPKVIHPHHLVFPTQNHVARVQQTAQTLVLSTHAVCTAPLCSPYPSSRYFLFFAAHNNVFSRLQALFPPHPSNHAIYLNTPLVENDPPTLPAPSIPRLEVSDILSPPPPPPPPKIPERPFLKIRIITWNHGYSLPKGDLETLLGTVPVYEPLPPDADRSKLPALGLDDAHPYHIIVM